MHDGQSVTFNQLKSLCRDYGFAVTVEVESERNGWLVVLSRDGGQVHFVSHSIALAVRAAGDWARKAAV